jgi:hypothetical protein
MSAEELENTSGDIIARQIGTSNFIGYDKTEIERRKIMDRPPPYFPQSQLSPPDEKRYKKFKAIIALAIVALILLLAGIGIGIYYLINRLAA